MKVICPGCKGKLYRNHVAYVEEDPDRDFIRWECLGCEHNGISDYEEWEQWDEDDTVEIPHYFESPVRKFEWKGYEIIIDKSAHTFEGSKYDAWIFLKGDWRLLTGAEGHHIYFDTRMSAFNAAKQWIETNIEAQGRAAYPIASKTWKRNNRRLTKGEVLVETGPDADTNVLG